MINLLQFVNALPYFDSFRMQDKPIETFAPLARINYFIGANNSGKSRFLRGLVYELYRYERFPSPNTMDFIDDIEDVSIGQIPLEILMVPIRASIDELRAQNLDEDYVMKISDLVPSKSAINEYELKYIYRELEIQHRQNSTISNTERTPSGKFPNQVFQEETLKLRKELEKLFPVGFEDHLKITYVPIARSAKKMYAFKSGKNKVKIDEVSFVHPGDLEEIDQPLKLRTLKDHFSEISPEDTDNLKLNVKPDTIFTGETLYQMLTKLYNGLDHKRQIRENFQDFLSKYFFNGERLQITAVQGQGFEDIYVKVGDGAEYPLQQLGDGIQAIILLVFPLFYYQQEKHHVIFYEEPELYLHPGMQRIFIEALQEFPNTQVFIATHSNHLLGTTLDYPQQTSVFSFEKRIDAQQNATFVIENLASPSMSLLNALGVRNTSVFLSNCTIWVEGISDRIYLKKYLELYIKEKAHHGVFVEDLHYSFLEFGGNNIVHYDFADEAGDPEKMLAKKITNRIFLIHDADKGKEERHALLYHQLGEQYHQLPVLEMENLLTPATLQATFQEYRKSSSAELIFNHLDDTTQLPLSEIATQMISSGELKKIFSPSTDTLVGKLYDKAGFAKTAIQHLSDWKDLSQPAQALTEKLYQFIQQHNTGRA